MFKKSHLATLLSFVFYFFACPIAKADQTAVLFGMSQPLLFNGKNIEVNYLTERFVFEYSHGWDLNISNFEDGLTDEEKDQKLKIRTPYTTGGGIGYRFTNTFHASLEFKLHKFQVKHPTEGSFEYRTQTLGVGVYYIWKPFKNSGFTVMPALRYWPTVATSLTNNRKRLSNGDVHEAHKFDIAPNIKIGWTF